ncbi:hypothetical protein D3C87_1400190 [compost metagenome]
MAEEVFGLSAIAVVSVDASKCGCIEIQLGKVALDVPDDMVMLFTGELGNLPARHGDRIAWSVDRVHNGSSSVLQLLKKPT